ncbi:MAG: hypothetical protein CL910_11660 [Deltaproteobacteria bacterium]|jgi:hypothetical protein|nr:hypothetical protein [Deltaproteobacteria bacterium]
MSALALRLLLAWLVLSPIAACSPPPELQTVSYRQLASFQAPEAWASRGEVDGELQFVHARHPEVELWVSGESQDLGHTLTIGHLRSLIGREVNLEYGGAVSRLSMGGNAVVRYPTRGEAQDEPDAVRWIVARLWSGSHMLRLDVSIEYLVGDIEPAEFEALVAEIDPTVSDARFHSAGS